MDETRKPADEGRAWASVEILRRELARNGNRVAVVSTSMGPLSRPGDQFLVTETRGRRGIRFGDVVLAFAGGRPVTHRSIGRKRGGYVLKGDGAPRADPPVLRRDVVGVAGTLVAGGRALTLNRGVGRAVSVVCASISWAEDAFGRWGAAAQLTRRIFYVALRLAVLPLAFNRRPT